MKSKIIQIQIKPLSVNEAWQGKRYKTVAYKNYEKNLMLLLPSKIIIPDLIRLDITYWFSNSQSDVDNPTKLLIDILQKKYKFNDSKVYEIHLYKKLTKKGSERIEVIISGCLPFV